MEEEKASTGPKRILLLTNSEHGQANVFLATSYALLTLQNEDVEVHFASFPRIRSSVLATSEHVQRDRPGARPIVFHTVDGKDMVSAWTRPEIVAEQRALNKRSVVPFVDVVRRTLVLLKVTLPWTGPEFVQIMRSVAGIVEEVQPDITAVDPAFAPALTVLRHLGVKSVILTPNTIKDFAMPLQPNAEPLWKYPSHGTAHMFPLPWRAIPLNFLLIVLSLIVTIIDPHRRALAAYLTANYHPDIKLTTLATLTLNPLAMQRAGVRLLVANTPEIEFPLTVARPSHILPCGPILRPVARPLIEADPDLATWLAGGPMVYINLGTHVFYDAAAAAEMAGALRWLLAVYKKELAKSKEKRGQLRVLWKIPRRGVEVEAGWKKVDGVFGPGGVVERLLGDEVRDGVIRIVEWLEPEPTAVLEAGTVVCAVHHGGANSFLEAVSAGIPQVVLPLWMDTYDFARRAEILGIGRWGNRGAGKICKSNQLGEILTDVVVGERSTVYASKAKELAELCKKSGGGRVIAARHILAALKDAGVTGMFRAKLDKKKPPQAYC
ncbi:hypothetical protein VTI28DRAFT_5468 [Corynascus sepedonium]